MSDTFRIDIEDRQVADLFARLAASVSDLTPPMRAISMLLLSRTEGNFAAESGPSGPWPALAAATSKKRGGSAKMLQDTGRLAASVHPFHSATEAGIGAGVIYAAIHQLGGQAGRGHKVTIPARPFMPADAHGLQAGVGDDILDIVAGYVQKAGSV